MRTIKFRGKRLDGGSWIYGDIIQYPDNGSVEIIDNYNEMAWVNPATVGQFTGLLDRNGQEIYEGDIIETLGSGGNPIRHYVQYNDERGGYSQYLFMGDGLVVDPFDGGLLWQQYITDCEKYVISNIHDIKIK